MFSNIRSLFTRGFGKNESGKAKLAVALSLVVLLFATGVYFVSAEGQATITTSKKRYEVGETIYLSGSGFTGGAFISIDVLRPDHATESLGVHADAAGAFLDLAYTPAFPQKPGRYKFTATDGSNTATTATTEADQLGFELHQCAQNDKVGNTPLGLGNCNWVVGSLGSGNAQLYEGITTEQQLIITGITATPGNVHTLRVGIQATKGGHHAYDWLTSDADINGGDNPINSTRNSQQASALTGITLDVNRCGDELGNQAKADCQALVAAADMDPNGGVNTVDIPVPDDPFISQHGSTQTRIDNYENGVNGPNCVLCGFGNRTVRLYTNQPVTNASMSLVHMDGKTSGNPLPNGADTGDSYVWYTITWTGSPTSAMLVAGADIALGGNGTGRSWGAGNGATGIEGNPYHFYLIDFDGVGGSKDNQMSAAAIFTLPSTITITKDAVPNDAQDFAFAVTGTGWANFSLDDDGSAGSFACTGGDCQSTHTFTFNGADATGTKTITEGLLTDWTLTNLVCSKGTVDLANRTVSIPLEQGELVTCTFTNTKKARVRLAKDCIPDGETTVFDFTYQRSDGSLNSGVTRVCDSGLQLLFETTAVADLGKSWTITELEEAGWDPTFQSCTGPIGAANNPVPAGDPGDPGPFVGFTLDAGDQIDCTFTNTKRGSIRVTKTAVGGNGSFDFVSNFGLTSPMTTIGGTATQLIGNLPAGSTYNLSETPEQGWTITTGLSCKLDDGTGASTGTPSGSPVNALTGIQVEPGKITACTITNTGFGHVIIVKDAVPNDAQDFTFANNFGNGNPASFDLDDDGDPALTNSRNSEVAPGTYNVSETVPPGWSQVSATCSDQSPVTAIDVSPGETVTCTFVNAKPDLAIAIAPPSETNQIGQEHVFTITVTQTPNTATAATSVAITPALTGNLANLTTNSNTCGPNVSFNGGNVATCTYTINANAPGLYTLNGSATATVGGVSLTRDTDPNTAPTSGPGGTGPGTKRYVNATIAITPSTDTNEVGQAHVFTITYTQDAGGGTPAATANISTSFVGAPPNTVGPTTCGAAVSFNGGNTASCTLSISHPSVASFTVHATGTASIDGIDVTRETNGTAGNSGDAVKHFVNATIAITPSTATNQVGQAHVFTITYTQVPGGATPATTANISTSFVGGTPNTVGPTTCGAAVSFNGGNTATCTLSINHPSVASFTVHATGTAHIGNIDVTRETNGTAGNSGDAVKNYVNATIAITPSTATNQVGQAHVFTITYTQVPGSATPAATANISTSFVGGTPNTVGPTTCGAAVSFNGGNTATCTLSISHPTPATFTVHATGTANIGGIDVTRETNGTAGNSGNAVKHYVDMNIVITPNEDTNPVGQAHVFTITVTQFPSTSTPAATANITPSLTGNLANLTVNSNTCGPAIAFAANVATCTYTINAAAPGDYTLNASAVATVGGIVLTRDTDPNTAPTAGAGGSGPALKHYVAGNIIVRKLVVPNTNTTAFEFDTSWDVANFFLQHNQQDDSGPLPPGSGYSVAEVNVPAGWQTQSSCSDGSPINNIDLSAGETVTCTFTNTAQGTIRIIKDVIVGPNQTPPDFASDNFSFDPSAGVNSGSVFKLDDDNGQNLPGPDGVTPTNGAEFSNMREFTNILAGVHTVEELASLVPGEGLGWELRTISCTESVTSNSTTDVPTGTATINLDPGETVECTFRNHQADMPVTKLVDGRVPTCVDTTVPPNGTIDSCTDPVMGEVIGAFGIQLYPDTDADDGEGADTTTPLSPVVPIPPVFEPDAPIGIPFSICEVPPPAGWKLIATNDVVLNAIPNQVTDTTPIVYYPGAPAPANTRCFDVLIPDGTTTFEISINNIPQSKIITKKLTVPPATAGTFDFNATWDTGAAPDFQLQHNGENDSDWLDGTQAATAAIPNPPTVSHTVSEVVPAGWDLTGMTCVALQRDLDPGSSVIDTTTEPNSVISNLKAGEIVTCTYENTKLPTLTVVKLLNPTNDAGRFDLKINTVEYATNVGHNGSTGAQLANIGANTFAENGGDTPSTSLSDYVSVVGGDAGCGGTATAGTITLAAGENKTCTITNTRKGSIKVVKCIVGPSDTFSFTPTGFSMGNLTPSAGTLATPSCADTTTGGLVPTAPHGNGSYNLEEGTLPSGWQITTPLSCDHGSPTQVNGKVTGIVVAPGETTTCTITNTKRASLEVRKDCTPDDAENLFDFTWTKGGAAQNPFQLGCLNQGGANKRVLISPTIDPASVNGITYVITEGAIPSDWAFDGVSCTGNLTGAAPVYDNANRKATVVLDYGEDIVCTFKNKAIPPQRFTGGGSFYPNTTDVPKLGEQTPFSEQRITHGFTLHCNIGVDPNRLEVNWAGAPGLRGRASENNFHLEKLTAAVCTDDQVGGFSRNSNPNSNNGNNGIDEESPNAGVDTYEGWGWGRFNNVPNALAHWIITDAGEPGKDRDEIWIVIWTQNANGTYTEALRIGGDWTNNLKAIPTGALTLNRTAQLLTAGYKDLLVPNGATCSAGAQLCTPSTLNPDGSVAVWGNGRYGPGETGARTGRDGADIQSGNQQAHKGTNGQ